MILGSGLDVIDIARFERELSRHGDGLLTAVLTGPERQRAAALRRPASGAAVGFAVKEACLKALGTGLVGRMSWQDMTLTADRGCAPRLTLEGETARVAAGLGVTRIHASFALTRGLALAWVMLLGGGGRDTPFRA